MPKVKIVQSDRFWSYEDTDGPIVRITRGSYLDEPDSKNKPSYHVQYSRVWAKDGHEIVSSFKCAIEKAEEFVKVYYEAFDAEQNLLAERYKKSGDGYSTTL